MGGMGSGPYGYGGKRAKAPTSRCCSLDIRRLKRDKLLRPGMGYTWTWTTTRPVFKETVGTSSIGINVLSRDEMQLTYEFSRGNEEPTPVKETIDLDFTSCSYGGERVWFCCPSCDKRVALLYLKGSLFRCRHCHDLTYRSCQDSGKQFEETLRRANAVLVKLKHEQQYGFDMLYCNPLFKPKGMHQSTFSRLRREFQIAKTEYANAMNASMSGSLARLKQSLG